MRFKGLTLNAAKTQILQLGASKEHVHFLGQKPIQKQSNVICFGLKVDKKMAFTVPFNEFVKRTSKHLRAIERLINMLSIFFLLRYYIIYVKSVEL